MPTQADTVCLLAGLHPVAIMNDRVMPSGTPPHQIPIYVNGRFLGRPLTGVERFAGGILHAIDDLLDDEQAKAWTILVPKGVSLDQGFRKIAVKTAGRLTGHAWEQIDLLAASRDGILVNPCNSAPVLHGRQLTVIHDALVYRFPQGFSRSYRLLHQTLGRLLARRSRLATVSDFSRKELSDVLKVPVETISVISNAVDHMVDVTADETVLDRLGLRDRRYFLFIGSPAPNKNLARAIQAFGALDRSDVSFVLVGKAAKAFSKGEATVRPAHLLETGRLSDAEILSLYAHAQALVFPSLYEGFGIPPLEAMRENCPVLASDIPVLREVCGDAAAYFDPLDTGSMSRAMLAVLDGQADLQALRQAGRLRSAEFSWKNSATELLRVVTTIASSSR